MPGYKTIQANEITSLKPCDGVILDVRTSMEHDEKQLGCRHAHIPLDQLNPTDFMLRHGLDKDAHVYILCRTGKRAAQAAEQFAAKGYGNTHVIEGGIVACEDCGQRVAGHAVSATAGPRHKSRISLERQVRIAAGFLAFTGALLALTINPLLALVPLFVGGGLVFAGVTDICGMALILTKAPWNKVDEDK
ncbi:MAG: DUF2892 domain-containing protein [Alphaproteobacteria bacterium]|nr:DUF2892 domain-containing protein [Alphaproteobacteria bacterium]